ncbi:MAG: potassium channel family protein [Dehalogenimonas sp.]
MSTTLKRLLLVVGVLLVIVAAGTGGFMAMEKLAFFNAFYLTVMTITTVGYGDLVAVTTGGKILSMVIVITGFTFFTAVVVTSVQLFFERREDTRRAQQLNTLTTLFFSEIGDNLLRMLNHCDQSNPLLLQALPEVIEWTEADFLTLTQVLKRHRVDLDPLKADGEALRKLLTSSLLFRLLEAPHVFEHDLFNSLLRAIFHLRGELTTHPDLAILKPAKIDHLATDITRIYQPLVKLWLEHMNYLKRFYPVLFFSLLEKNPFKPAIITNNDDDIAVL